MVAVEEVATPSGAVLLRTSHTDDGVLGGLAEAVAALVADARCRLVEVDGDRWLDAWRDHARPQPAGHRLVVVPAWLDDDRGHDGRIPVVLDPGRAFGSGGHASTRVALAALDALLVDVPPRDAEAEGGGPTRGGATGAGPTVLDVGCGSGVLAIAALLLGAGRARAVDVDPEAVRATAENAARNGVADRLEVDDRSLDDVPGPYELVVANVLAPTLVELAPGLVAHLAPGGHLVLAGMLDDQAARVVTAVERAARAADRSGGAAGGHGGLREVLRFDEDGWVAVVLARP